MLHGFREGNALVIHHREQGESGGVRNHQRWGMVMSRQRRREPYGGAVGGRRRIKKNTH